MIIPHSRPTLHESDIQAVANVMRSGHIAQGVAVSQFEEQLASYIGVKGGVATSSGTAALHLALLALGIGEGDEVAMPSYVCSALLHAVLYTGGSPLLVDIDPHTLNLDVKDLRKRLTRKTKAVIVPHMFGLPATLDEIASLGLPMIEDCAHSIGATYKGNQVGSFGEIAIFSFYATKMLATGEGGMIVSRSQELLDRVRDLREYDEKEDNQIRYNYKMTDMQGALGLSQLSQLETFISKRRAIARTYTDRLNALPLILPGEYEESTHIYYRYVIRISQGRAPYHDLMTHRAAAYRRPVYRPLHTYVNLTGFPNSDQAWQEALSIPIYPSLSDEEIDLILTTIHDCFKDRGSKA